MKYVRLSAYSQTFGRFQTPNEDIHHFDLYEDARMSIFRREFLKLATSSATGVAATALLTPGAQGQAASMPGAGTNSVFDVKYYGAKGDGVTIDTPAINKAIEAANAGGGGTVRFPSGTYACYSIRLKSSVVLYLEQGATV